MSGVRYIPPRLGRAFLRFFCNKDFLIDIEGDLWQFYCRRAKEKGKRYADLLFYRDVLLLFRPGIIRPIMTSQKLKSNKMELFKHSFKISARSFLRYKGSFLINLLGLSTGLACVLMIYLWINSELATDQYHVKKDRLYQMLENVDQGGGLITRVTSPGPMAIGLMEDFPEIERAVTVTWPMNFTLSAGDQNFKSKGVYARNGYFDLFTFNFLEGNSATVLEEMKSIVISRKLAENLFGTSTGVVGQLLTLQQKESYQVTGIFDDIPKEASLKIDFVIPFSNFWDEHEWVRTWYNTAPRTFVLLKEDADVTDLNEKLFDYVREKTEGNADHRSPFLAKYADRYLYGKYEEGKLSGGRIDYLWLFGAIALFILVIACINFMNLATARASRKMKEVGVKKTVGANRGALIFQYLTESYLITSISLLAALTLVVLCLPQFNDIAGKELNLFDDKNIIWGSLIILIVTGLLAGSYPAFYLSSFTPIKVLRGKLQGSIGENWIRKGLVTFQFSLSTMLIVAVIVVYGQIMFTQDQHLGYDKENVVVVNIEGALTDSLTFLSFVRSVNDLQGVTLATGGDHSMIGHNGGTYGINWPGKDPDDRTEFENMVVSDRFIEVLKIGLSEGRFFDAQLTSDYDKIIFNEAAIAYMGLEDPVGKNVELWGRKRQIVGVVKDFNFESLHERVKPIFMVLASEYTDYLYVKVNGDATQSTLTEIDELHQKANPGFALEYHFLEQDYQNQYTAEQRVSVLSGYFAIIAIIISCLGLLGLASFTIEVRSKEIGIKKILGASEFMVISQLTYNLVKSTLVSVIIGLPLSYYFLENWLQGFAYRMELSWWIFGLGGALMIIISILTVVFQTASAWRINPVSLLRDE